MDINQGSGKIYRQGSEVFVGEVYYKLYEESAEDTGRWWGELTFTESVSVRESDRYLMELSDGRRGWCYLKKLVNKVARGVPPRYVYHFSGFTSLERGGV